MPRPRRRVTPTPNTASAEAASPASVVSEPQNLIWLKAEYHLHTFAYRDPRSAFSAGIGLPVVSPTAVLLGIASTLFSLGRADEALSLLTDLHRFRVAIDPPTGMIFFRAFHQLRRYETDKYGPNPRLGLTNINQGTREYGLPHGNITVYVGVLPAHAESVTFSLTNRDHLGTHDSVCSLVGAVQRCGEPEDVIYFPPETWQTRLPNISPVTVLTLSRFKKQLQPTVGNHWWMAGGDDTELVPYLIRGSFRGTTRGKIYTKDS